MKPLILIISLLLAACDVQPGNGTFDPRNFGAILNDGFDDSFAIQAAADSCAAQGGGIIVLARGTWTIGGPVALRSSGVSIQGLGVDVTILQRASDAPIFVVTQDISHQRISDLTLDGVNTNYNAPLMDTPAPWRRSELSHVKFTNYRNGLRLAYSEVAKLETLEFVTPDVLGTSLQVGDPNGNGGGANLTINDTLMRGGNTGVAIYDFDAVFMHNTDIGAKNIGLLIFPSVRSNNHKFEGNYFDQTQTGASVVLGGAGVKGQILFAGNWIASSPFGVQLQSGGVYSDISFVGGRVFNIGQVGMIIDAPVASLLIQGVQFSAIRGSSVLMTPNARGSQVDMQGNAFREAGAVARQF